MHDQRLKVCFDEKTIDAIFKDLDSSRAPGVAVGIAIGGEPVYRKAFGLASMELPIALSPRMGMRIGSISKQVTCLAYLLLCEEGLACIEDPLAKYLPDLSLPCRNVSMRQLMTHTSGLRDACDIRLRFAGYGGVRTSTADILRSYRQIADVNGPPGETWIYNNGAYVLLSAVIERIADRSLEQIIRERVLAPIGMSDTMLRRWDTDPVPNSARSHTAVSPGVYDTSTWELDFSGAGALVSTVDDMLRWLVHMDAPEVGTIETWTAIKTAQDLRNGMSSGYGLGVAKSRYRGLETLSHIGGWTGANAQVVKAPACGLDVVVMANRSDVFSPLLVNRIIDACVPGLEPVHDERGAQAMTGNYLSRTTKRILQFFSRRDGQQMVAIDGHELPYVTGPDCIMRPAPAWRHIKRFIRIQRSGGSTTPVKLDDFGNTEDVDPIDPPRGPEDARVCGTYRSDTTETNASISDCHGDLVLRLSGPFGSTAYSLAHVANNIWRATPRGPGGGPIGAALTFDGDQSVLRFSTAATRSFPFRRVG